MQYHIQQYRDWWWLLCQSATTRNITIYTTTKQTNKSRTQSQAWSVYVHLLLREMGDGRAAMKNEVSKWVKHKSFEMKISIYFNFAWYQQFAIEKIIWTLIKDDFDLIVDVNWNLKTKECQEKESRLYRQGTFKGHSDSGQQTATPRESQRCLCS